MSELKVFKLPLKTNIFGRTIIDQSYYEKTEADKVIKKLNEKLDLYKRGWAENDKVNAYLCAELRHQKYKRCLAMVWWCSAELGMLISTWESKIKHYKKWYKRWLEIAEKFKEAK